MPSGFEKKYKYSTKIQAFAKVVPEIKHKEIATASLKSLTEIFDDNMQEKIKENPDLLYIVSNLILLDYANYNNDCVLKSEILSIYEKFEDKWLDIEHDRKVIVGMISEAGFSEYGSNIVVDDPETYQTGSNTPLQLTIGGFLWRVINNTLCQKIEEASIESSPLYGKISTSFELLFDDYDIGLGENGERDVNKCRIIKESDEDWVKYNKMLIQNGGSGYSGKTLVFRILKDVWPAGAGIVVQPASGLKGILALNENNAPVGEEKEGDNEEVTDQENVEDAKKECLTSTTSSVLTNNNNNFINKTMPVELKSVDDIVNKWSELVQNEANASQVRQFIADEIVKESTKFAATLAEKENLIKTVEANKIEAENKSKELENTVATLKAQLNEIAVAQQKALAEQKYNERMAVLDETFDLSEEDSAILAEEVRAIDTDESFAMWFDKKKKFNKEKTKAYKCEKKKEMEEKFAKAGVSVEIDEKLDFKKILASASVQNGVIIPSTTSNVNNDLKDMFKKAFAENTTIGGKKLTE
jgi:hypothetical protein